MADGDADVADVEVALRPRGRRNRRESGRLDFAGSRKAMSTRSWCGARRSRCSPMEQWRDEREPSRPKSELKARVDDVTASSESRSPYVSVDEGGGFGSRLTRDIPARARRSRHRELVLATARVRQADRARRTRALVAGGPVVRPRRSVVKDLAARWAP